MTIQHIIETTKTLRIVSGEGENGAIQTYTGKRTMRALKARITRECCEGDRWARVEYVRVTDVDGNDHYDTLPL